MTNIKINIWRSVKWIISLIDKHYVLDKRGIAFKAGYDYYREYSFDAIQLKQEAKQAKNYQELNSTLAKIKPISRAKTRGIIKTKSEDLIEAQDDLADLEEFWYNESISQVTVRW